MMPKYTLDASAARVGAHRLVERTEWRSGRARRYLQCINCGEIGEGARAFRVAECSGEGGVEA